jgi:hypothetical protein
VKEIRKIATLFLLAAEEDDERKNISDSGSEAHLFAVVKCGLALSHPGGVPGIGALIGGETVAPKPGYEGRWHEPELGIPGHFDLHMVGCNVQVVGFEHWPPRPASAELDALEALRFFQAAGHTVIVQDAASLDITGETDSDGVPEVFKW